MKKMNLGLQQAQKQTVSPQLQQAVKILQLSSLELADRVERELYENPFLEMEESGSKEDVAKSSAESATRMENHIDNNLIKDNQSKETESYTNEELFDNTSDLGYPQKSFTNKGYDDKKQQFIENLQALEVSLYDHLLSQLRFLDISDEEFFIGEVIISSLNDNGYLGSSVDEIATLVKKTHNIVTDMLERIQAFDPPGIAGRNLAEVLIIQLKQSKKYSKLIEKLIIKDLNTLEKGKFKELSSKYDISIENLKRALKVITTLEPIPARQFDHNTTKYILPDIVIHCMEDHSDDNQFAISINDLYIPTLHINHEYNKLLKTEKLNPNAKSYFRDKYNEAKFLISSISKRKETIMKVVEQITILQKEFFQKGIKYLRPLVLKDIAKRINIHESTVSRVTSNKYVDTPWGIFELKYFFSGKIGSGEHVVSSRSIKEAIKNIIINETDEKTLSDQMISDILKNNGVDIARRTVSKYRKSLKILPSFKRKD